MRLLIVDDNARVRTMIRSIVEDLAESVDECEDGESAVERCRAARPDWVLMDLRLGGIDGIEATRMIVDDAPSVRVAIVTNYDEDDLRAAARAAGAAAYVVKNDLLALRDLLV